MKRSWWPIRFRRPAPMPPPEPDQFDRYRDPLAAYVNHRVLSALLYESGGRIDIRADTIAALREHEEITVDANPEAPGAVIVRLRRGPPAQFRFRKRFRW